MDEVTAVFTYLPPPFNMIVLVVLITSVAGVITAVCREARKYADRRSEHQFKLEMLQNGLTAEEAERWLALKVDKPNK